MERKDKKLFYSIGEVSRITEIAPYILRYWESEFKLLKPDKSRNRQRIYKKKDLDTVFKIKDLLYNQRFTIAGAKNRLKEVKKEKWSQPDLFQINNEQYKSFLLKLKKELEELKNILSE